jgi:hypothetical protein
MSPLTIEQINALNKEVHFLLDQSKYAEAKKRIFDAVEKVDKESENYHFFLSSVAGLLIDLGAEARDKEAAEAGTKILSEDEEYFKSFISEESYYYCLGNGKQALFNINNPGVGLPSLEMIKPYLGDAKNYFYKAFKKINLNKLTSLDLQVLTNLANNLLKSGRVVEAIRLHDMVLKVNPGFPQAILGFAEDLDYWIGITACQQSTFLYFTIYQALKNGLDKASLPDKQKDHFRKQFSKYEKLLVDLNFDFKSIPADLKKHDIEFKQHTEFRKFCLENYLSLSEHSLFCKCSYASKDDLSIVRTGLSLYGEKVGKMELLLNRLKAEFHLARKLYYEGEAKTEEDSEVVYSDLDDGEVIGEAAEKIRTSFRLCFGIFDKIAHGLCYFFDLEKGQSENIYFDSFWNNRNSPIRWAKLKDMRNPHVVALYSIASDLNIKQGEFGFYKEWRNKLEHNNLILVKNTNEIDLLKLFENDKFIIRVPYSVFKDQALHLLQICCAAIFSYVYCIRMESFQSNDNLPTVSYFIQPKS